MKTVIINNHTFFHNNIRPQFFKDVENGKWEPDTFNVLEMFIKPGKTFIDIGAWNGVCSLYASSIGALCYAIEPDKDAWPELQANINLNNNIVFEPIGIGNKNGVIKLNSATKDGFGNSESSIIDRGNIANVMDIKTETLDTFISSRNIHLEDICLIKIDIEAGEVLVLPSIKEFLLKHKPIIYISFHPDWFPNKEKNIQEIISIIFPIYKVIGMNGNLYSKDDFIKAMGSAHEHNFILKP